jgi:hypothetical protein
MQCLDYRHQAHFDMTLIALSAHATDLAVTTLINAPTEAQPPPIARRLAAHLHQPSRIPAHTLMHTLALIAPNA